MLIILPSSVAASPWVIDPSTGSFHVLVEKDGILKALGHDHVVAVRSSRAEFTVGLASAALRLEIDSASLAIDDSADRRRAGYDETIPESDRAKINKLMRGKKTLDIDNYPLIVFESEKIEPVDDDSGMWMVLGTLKLRGVSRFLEFPVTRTAEGAGFWAEGYVRLRLSDFGIKPFSSALGMVKVKDEALVRFKLRALPR